MQNELYVELLTAFLKAVVRLVDLQEFRKRRRLPPVFSIDRRVERGCRCHRLQPDPTPNRFRGSDPPRPRRPNGSRRLRQR